MIDVLYPVRKEITSEQLRFSLRSLEANFSYNDIYIAGHIPRWCKNIVECRRDQANKHSWQNSYLNYKLALKRSSADQLLIMMDDIYFLKPLSSIPVWRGRKIGESPLGKNCETFRRISKILGCSTSWSYEFHIPFLVERDKLQFLFNIIDKEATGDLSDLYWRSLYGNYFRIGGTNEIDCKVWQDVTVRPDQPFLSSSHQHFKKHVRPFIQQLYPTPSTYEK